MKRNRGILSYFGDRNEKTKAQKSPEEETTQGGVRGGGTEGSTNQLVVDSTNSIPSENTPIPLPPQPQPQSETQGTGTGSNASSPVNARSANGSGSGSTVYDAELLPHDPGRRIPIMSYATNDQDVVRRGFILKGPCQPRHHDFPVTEISGKNGRFSVRWYNKYNWIEYSFDKDAVFCFVCYLFKEDKTVRGDSFIRRFRKWNRYDSVESHAGGITSVHNRAQEKYNFFVKPRTSISQALRKQTDEDKRIYICRLTHSIRCLRFILRQGLACRGHDESANSRNKGNFLELLEWLAENSEEVAKVVLNNAPGNCKMTCHDIQTEIINCCAIQTTKHIIEEIGDDHFSILADESSDMSQKEQLALCLRYVDKKGRVCERFLGVIHVADTTSLSLKNAIELLLVDHKLTLTQIRGQGYDGASNMKGEIKGLKTLIMKESPSAYYIHCFAHQLQLVLVAVAKGDDGCVWFFDQVSYLLNIIGVSCKRHDMLRNVQAQEVLEALEVGDMESGRGLNQEMGLARPSDIRWGTHYRTILRIIGMYSTIRKVLIRLGKDPSQRNDWSKIHTMVGVFESFEFIFHAHLMLVILGYTDDLSQALQRRDQDIVNAMSLVNLAKDRMQHIRSHGWEEFLQDMVTSFCTNHGIKVPKLDARYVPHGRSRRFYPKQTVDDHFRREVYIGVIDSIRQELDNRFDEVNMELLLCMSALNPIDSFASYDRDKVLSLAKFYPNDFSSTDLMRLPFQLDNFIDDMRRDDRFKGLNNLVELSIILVQTKKHDIYKLVYLLLKLVLLLPVATASVERVFSAMNLVKNKLRNSMQDQLLNDCLVTFIEQDIFLKLSDDDIIKCFQGMKSRRVVL